MKANEYQIKAARTAIYPTEHAKDYLTAGLCGEVGEVAQIRKREIIARAKYKFIDVRVQMLDELGDSLWHISEIASRYGITLEEVMEYNLKKLEKRHGNAN